MRTFKSICLLLTVVLLASCDSNAKKQEQEKEVEMLKKNIGLQMYSLRDPINDENVGVDAMIKEIGGMGYKYVETASYYDGTIYGMSPEEFKAKCEAAGFYPLACHVGKDLGSDPLNPDWDSIWAWWDKCIATHNAAGMSYIVTPSMPTPETLEGLKAYCDYYNAIGSRCDAHGMKFGYHNHAFEFEKKYDLGNDKSISMYDFMVENTNPNYVFFELDVYWANVGRRPPVELFEKYPNRFEVLHIKDSKELGRSGFVGFDAIFNHIDKSGAKYLIVEVENYNMHPVESVKASLDYLNKADFVKADYSK